jgi:hypothetical protein
LRGDQRREYPKAGAALGNGLGQRLGILPVGAGDPDTPVLLGRDTCARPEGVARQRGRRSMDPAIDPGDEVQLPDPALQLPDTQCQEAEHAQQRQPRQEPALRHGQEPMPACVMGIMLVLRWNMIHSEPEITIRTMTAAKA